MSVRSFRGLFGVVSMIGVLLVVGVQGAGAHVGEAKPFGVAELTMQTIEKQSIVKVSAVRPEQLGLENVPYTFTQAGGHPWGLSTVVRFTTEQVGTNGGGEATFAPTRDPKDIVVDLPPGLLGDPQAVPRCPLQATLAGDRCPADTQLGVFRIRWFEGIESIAPIVNLTPEKGQSAEFGLETNSNITVVLTAHVVRSGSTYALTVVSNEIPDNLEMTEVETTFWGVPADPSHDPLRGLVCTGASYINKCYGGGLGSGLPAVPFLSMPADCAAGPESTSARVDSWEEPGVYKDAAVVMAGATGCNLLQFDPGVEAQPDTVLADTPVGLGVNLKVPQVLSPEASETPQLRDAMVTLPEGLSISPGIVDGIRACNESGPEGINFEGPESEEVGLNGEPRPGGGSLS